MTSGSALNLRCQSDVAEDHFVRRTGMRVDRAIEVAPDDRLDAEWSKVRRADDFGGQPLDVARRQDRGRDANSATSENDCCASRNTTYFGYDHTIWSLPFWSPTVGVTSDSFISSSGRS